MVTEVADKFHLVKNIMERAMKLVGDHYDEYRTAVRREERSNDNQQESVAAIPQQKTIKEQKIDSRLVMFSEVKDLQSKGFKPTTIAKNLV